MEVAELATSAKQELGDAVVKDPVRVSCPCCGGFLLSAMSLPLLVKVRCVDCHIDVMSLVSRDREIMSTTYKH